MAKVYLDPGHGGYDSGAVGCGKREADCALEIAKRVCALLPSKYFDCKMSRTSNHTPNDSDPSADLGRRAAEANAWGADVFVSIHLNAGGGHGVETYRSVAGGKSTTLATDIQQAVQSATGMPAHGEPVKTKIGDYGRDWICVIRETNMPACLVECGFIDTKADMDAWNADKFARGIGNGICKYFGVPVATPVPAAKPTLRYAAASAAVKSDTTMDVTVKQGKCYTVRLLCDSGCPQVTAGNGSIVDITLTNHDGSAYYFKLTGKQRGAAGIFVGGKKIFVLKVV
ncbi:MAG: N-acetylmuramoyl-L-alanine amidase [Ruminococcaceae bacterium]|jgi:N-acetylmuramoyl-L-alanine amidase|nr:N-acetylmuramoyl-L-alanine amidase [Oscillospiraceae bacterium]